MKTSKLLICFVVALAVALEARGADEEDYAKWHWQARLEAASYTTLDWGVELGLNYYPIEYVGVGASLSVGKNFLGDEKSLHTPTRVIETDDVNNFAWFRAGVQLKSPALWKNRDGSLAISLRLDAGITMPIPVNRNLGYYSTPNSHSAVLEERHFAKNSGGRALFFHAKPAVSLDVERWQFWLGYTISDFDAYSAVRNITIDGQPLPLNDKRFMNGFTLGIGFRFQTHKTHKTHTPPTPQEFH